MQCYRLGERWLKSSQAEKDLGVPVSSQLDTHQKAHGILVCIRNSVASRTRGGGLTLTGGQTPTNAALSLPSSAGQARENTTKGS